MAGNHPCWPNAAILFQLRAINLAATRYAQHQADALIGTAPCSTVNAGVEHQPTLDDRSGFNSQRGANMLHGRPVVLQANLGSVLVLST